MTGRPTWLASILVTCLFGSLALAQSAEKKPGAPPLLRLMKMRQGGMVAEETCAIVYVDGTYRSETFLRKRTVATIGFENESLEVKEGKLDNATFGRLQSIIGSPQFRELRSPKLIRRIVEEDYDALQVAVFRAGEVQDLRYPTKASRKDHQQQLKPLLDWWQELRKLPAQSNKDAPKTRCAQ